MSKVPIFDFHGGSLGDYEVADELLIVTAARKTILAANLGVRLARVHVGAMHFSQHAGHEQAYACAIAGAVDDRGDAPGDLGFGDKGTIQAGQRPLARFLKEV